MLLFLREQEIRINYATADPFHFKIRELALFSPLRAYFIGISTLMILHTRIGNSMPVQAL